jgi:DNA-binding MarR family transcriptional regulator
MSAEPTPTASARDLARLVDVLAERSKDRVATVLSAHGLSLTDWQVLQVVAQAEDPGPTDVWEWTGMPRATITDVLTRLEARGLCTRLPDRGDRRRWRLKVTEIGRDLVRSLPVLIERAATSDIRRLSRAELMAARELLAAAASDEPFATADA